MERMVLRWARGDVGYSDIELGGLGLPRLVIGTHRSFPGLETHP